MLGPAVPDYAPSSPLQATALLGTCTALAGSEATADVVFLAHKLEKQATGSDREQANHESAGPRSSLLAPPYPPALIGEDYGTQDHGQRLSRDFASNGPRPRSNDDQGVRLDAVVGNLASTGI
jgi:hypothetical protein